MILEQDIDFKQEAIHDVHLRVFHINTYTVAQKNKLSELKWVLTDSVLLNYGDIAKLSAIATDI